ncbi:MAG: type II toxin-antitoxin system HicA family toxin [Planctomycetota bacterium]
MRHLMSHDCFFLREGHSHTVFKNAVSGLQSSVPRHTEVGEKLVRKICKDLGIPAP